VFFAGDALNTRNGRINPSPKRITADREAANQSAIRLLQLTPAVLACGHGAPLTNHSSQDLMAAFNLFRSE
jgi:glyoxylase-like metal-dependent hydrolase (beta-lactamase superfamily II)